MNRVLQLWNVQPPADAATEILSCCGSHAWAGNLAARRPFPNEQALFTAADECWRNLPEADWKEAFRSHPRIGESHAQKKTTAVSAAWSRSEQSQMSNAEDAILLRMQEGHRQYEERFGRIFIICASGKQPAEMLDILNRRLANDPAQELIEMGANLLVSINASPFNKGKMKVRCEMVAHRAKVARIPIVFVNLVGGNDGVIFDGSSIVADASGRIIGRGSNQLFRLLK